MLGHQLGRRDLLRAAGLTVAVVAAGGWSASAPAAAELRQRLVRSTYLPLVGSTFRLSAGGRAHDATLLPLRDIQRQRQKGADVPAENAFALRFLAAGDLAAGLYTVTHPAAGDVLLHLDPRPGRRGLLEAVVYSSTPRKGQR